jgi:2,6-dihydroxypseudooxynicotine hydrolase
MARDAQVDLIFNHFIPRYIATGVDANDMQRLVKRIDHWSDWCRIWSDEASKHESLASEAMQASRFVTASESWLRASIYYHYAKHLFAASPKEYEKAQESMLRCYALASPGNPHPMKKLKIPYLGDFIHAYLRLPSGDELAPLAIILPGLDACKEELHNWSDAFLSRGLATVTLDGPGQGESASTFPISLKWGAAMSAVLEHLKDEPRLNLNQVGVVGQSLGAFYSPLSASQEPRIKACIANCGPFSFGPVLPQMPTVSQEVFRIRAHLDTHEQALSFAHELDLIGFAPQIECPTLIVFGAGDKIIPASEGARLSTAIKGSAELVVYEEGNHVCFNIPYKFRPLTADWMREKLSAPN